MPQREPACGGYLGAGVKMRRSGTHEVRLGVWWRQDADSIAYAWGFLYLAWVCASWISIVINVADAPDWLRAVEASPVADIGAQAIVLALAVRSGGRWSRGTLTAVALGVAAMSAVKYGILLASPPPLAFQVGVLVLTAAGSVACIVISRRATARLAAGAVLASMLIIAVGALAPGVFITGGAGLPAWVEYLAYLSVALTAAPLPTLLSMGAWLAITAYRARLHTALPAPPSELFLRKPDTDVQ